MVFPVMRSKSVQSALILSAILHAVSSYTTFTDCPDGMWGTNCTNQCQCVETNTDSCNKVNGSCTCKTGWKGDTCSEDINECEEGTVSCPEHSFCNNTDGGFVCVCDDGFFGTDSTDALCKDCPDGMWGTNCTNQCQCVETNTDSCNEVNGSCTCKTGWKGDTCSEDINECEEGTVSCPEHSFCNNTDGGFVCVCDDGFFGTDSTDALCKDCPDGMWGTNCTNQCQCVETNTDSCNRVNGSCTCKTGWKGDTCSEDINECEEGTVSCPEHSFCKNTDGDFVCVCDDGFFGTDSTDALCKDCPDGMWGTNCTNQCQCVETNTDSCNEVNGSCTCKTGWKGDTCSEDINECEEGTVSCPEHSFCNNTDGGFVCVCDDGFFGTDSTDALCKDCPDGMWGTNCTNQCQCVETNTDSCNRVNGSCTCKTGWKGDTCSEDINECEEGTVSCPEHSFCKNTDGDFVCVCDDGFFGTDSTDALCKDCPDGMWGTNCTNQCQCVETNTDSCNEVNGSCTCKTGWKGDTCSEDINECEEGTVSCPEHSFCNNTDGGFVCVCDDGFFGTDSTDALCKDCPDGMWGTNCTNQCQCVETNTDSCNRVNGSCTCKTGWKGDTCSEDINECEEGTVSCPEHSFCKNTDGDFVCVCDDGFFGTDSTDALCKDCPDGMWGTNCTNQCQCVETNTDSCNKVNGSCTCKTGWKGDTCSEDINECEEITVSCPEHSFCNNTDGGFVCVCDDGFFGTDSTDALCKDCPDGMWGTNCTNQCQCVETNTDSCNKVNGSCTCKTGWKGDTCSEDINECEEGTVSCPEHSFCNNTDGGFVCVCDDGYFNTENPDALCKECDRNHYGPSCSLQCACEEYGICDKVDGTCTCMRGFTGPHCKTDVDECHEGTHTCEVSRHEECKNLEEGFDCVCHSGYHRTCPICECTEISTHLVETVFEYDTSKVDFTKGSEDMKRLSKDIEEKMFERLSAQGLTVISVIVIELREGSLIAPMQIEIVGKTQNSSTELTKGLLQAMDADPMVLDNKLAKIKQINSSGEQFTAEESKCQRRQKLEPCTGRRQCVESDGVARCKLTDDGDEEALILGLEIGVPLFVIVCIVVGATIFHRIRKDKMKDKSVLVRKERGHTGMGDAMRVSTGDDRYKREFASATNPAFSRDDTYLTRASRGSTWLEHPLVNQQGASTFLGQRIELTELRADHSRLERRRDEFEGHRPQQRAKSASFGNEFSYIYRGSGMYQGVAIPRVGEPKPDYAHH